jgi:dihydrolipoamide dehydrogenase
VTETESKAGGVSCGKGVFPWRASGRLLTLGRSERSTKLLLTRVLTRLLDAGIVGSNAGDLIAEAAHDMETGSNATDIGRSIHPHPTLAETIGRRSLRRHYYHLYLPKNRK